MAKDSDILKDSNEFSANQLYDYRNNFKNMIQGSVISRFDAVLRSNFERPFYLRKDSKGNTIFLSEGFLKELFPKQDIPVLAHDFVRDAFYDMNIYFVKGLNTGKLKKTGSPFSSLIPRKGFTAHQKSFANFLFDLNKNFLNYLTKQKLEKKILNLDTFITYFLDFLKNQDEKVFTRSKFLETIRTDNFINGVSISLALDDFSNDYKKISNYVSDNNFPFFLECCRRFGFSVDKDAPWKIQYDFSSPATEPYLKKYNLKNKDDVIEKRYYKAYFSDVDILRDFLITSYVVFYNIEDRVEFVIDVNKCKEPLIQTINKEKVSELSVIQNYPNFYWLKLYLDIKIIEDNLNIVKAKYDQVLNDARIILKLGRVIKDSSEEDKFYEALDYINFFVLESRQKLDAKKMLEY